MQNRLLLFVTSLLISIPANVSDMTVLNGQLTIFYMFIVIPITLLIHFFAIIYFNKRDYYLSKAFTRKHLLIAMLVPALGVAIIIYEYLTNLSNAGIHIGTLVPVLFVYGLIALLFAIPHLIHLTASEV